MTVVFAALAVGPTLWLGLVTPDCAPVDQGACEFGRGFSVRGFSLGGRSHLRASDAWFGGSVADTQEVPAGGR